MTDQSPDPGGAGPLLPPLGAPWTAEDFDELRALLYADKGDILWTSDKLHALFGEIDRLKIENELLRVQLGERRPNAVVIVDGPLSAKQAERLQRDWEAEVDAGRARIEVLGPGGIADAGRTPTVTEKPLLLLDVDGPLNPYAAPPTRRPEGYQTFHLHDSSFTDAQGRKWTEGGIRVWLSPAHGAMLLALTDLVDLVWATAWEQMANTLIGPVLGLPELPVIHFPRRQSYPFGQIFKRDDVEQWAAGRPFAWFDDDFQIPGDYDWAAKRTESGHPTFLRWVDPAIGLRQRDVDLVADWARELTAAKTSTKTADHHA